MDPDFPDDDGIDVPQDANSPPIPATGTPYSERIPDRADLRPPRCWTTFAVAGVSLAISLFAGTVALLVMHGAAAREMLQDESAILDMFRSRLGLFVLVVIPQLALVIPSVAAAILSPVPVRERLGLVRGNWPIWAWVAAAAATPLIGLISGLITGLLMDESESLKQMSEVFREHGKSGFLFPLAMMIGATPAICEELLFRGFIQTRLVRSFGPLAGILVASALFACFHLDFVHVFAVFPLGLFLGWVAFQSGSIFPAMLAHFVNNVISVVAVVMAPDGQTDVLSLPTIAVSLTVIGTGIIGMTAVLIASILYTRPTATSDLPAG